MPLILNDLLKLLLLVKLFGLYSPGPNGLLMMANLRKDFPNVDFEKLSEFSWDLPTEWYAPGPGTKSLIL